MSFLRGDFTVAIVNLIALIGAPVLLWQALDLARRGLKNFIVYRKLSFSHLDSVTDEAIDSQAYMNACVLILMVRIFAALFGVILSALLTVSTQFLHAADPGTSYMQLVSQIFLAASSAFLIGTLISAKRFSDLVRKKVAPNTIKTRPLI